MQGVVVSVKQQKTAVVKIERRVRHPLLGKSVLKSKKYHVHDPEQKCSLGSLVSIQETAPISKLKRWVVLSS
jgi:small subunit ribosomal protein S17